MQWLCGLCDYQLATATGLLCVFELPPAGLALHPYHWLQAYCAVEGQGIHLVIANELHSRKDRVWLVQQAVAAQQQQAAGMAVQKVERPPHVAVIEELLVAEVVVRHQQHMRRAATAAARD
jgi:hypothetical protein